MWDFSAYSKNVFPEKFWKLEVGIESDLAVLAVSSSLRQKITREILLVFGESTCIRGVNRSFGFLAACAAILPSRKTFFPKRAVIILLQSGKNDTQE